MKIISIIIICIVLIIVLFQVYIIMSTYKTEEQKFTLVKDYTDFQIRFYPSATIASIHSKAKTYRELANPGFRNLAGYIFGGNEANQKIAMTAPVHMDIHDSVSKMSFVMPSTLTLENLPKPNDPNVNIEKSSAEYVAVIQFGGFASDKDITLYSEKLQALLKSYKIKPIGHYRLYGYNPPYQLINRRNEVVVAVEWIE